MRIRAGVNLQSGVNFDINQVNRETVDVKREISSRISRLITILCRRKSGAGCRLNERENNIEPEDRGISRLPSADS